MVKRRRPKPIDPTVLNARGWVRKPPANGALLHAHEVDIGWSVVNDWDKALVETWADRKARRAREAGRAHV